MSWMSTMVPSVPMNAILSGSKVSFIQKGIVFSLAKTKIMPWSSAIAVRCISPVSCSAGVSAISTKRRTALPVLLVMMSCGSETSAVGWADTPVAVAAAWTGVAVFTGGSTVAVGGGSAVFVGGMGAGVKGSGVL